MDGSCRGRARRSIPWVSDAARDKLTSRREAGRPAGWRSLVWERMESSKSVSTAGAGRQLK